MDIFFLVEIMICIVFSFLFFLVGVNETTWWRGIIFFFVSMLGSIVAIPLILATTEVFNVVFSMLFLFLFMIDFVFVILLSIQAFNQQPSRNRRYRPEPEE